MNQVDITTGARLHFGLLCAGRNTPGNFGGVGLMIRNPGWQLSVRSSATSRDRVETQPSEDPSTGELTQRVHSVLHRIRHGIAAANDSRWQVTVRRSVPLHSGFGAGTQLALSIAAAVSLLTGQRRTSATALATLCGRSRRSAVGTFGFDHGGFLIDHGITETDTSQRVKSISVPGHWRFVIVRRPDRIGLNGSGESAVFARELQMTPTLLRTLRTLTTDTILPAIRDAEFESFASSLADYGRAVGEFFAAEQGSCFSDPFSHMLADALSQRSLPAPIQSSWGPAVAIPANSDTHAAEILRCVSDTPSASDVVTEVTEAMPCGASIRTAAPESGIQRTWG